MPRPVRPKEVVWRAPDPDHDSGGFNDLSWDPMSCQQALPERVRGVIKVIFRRRKASLLQRETKLEGELVDLEGRAQQTVDRDTEEWLMLL
ncbi:hypothetical protein NDU88_008222 [Pleurodeles waltl]|uniref:Uncharacterized protein n=1 Tax=Pleurodeles waltl TaxID=8319 RepID=A0AAV7VWN9_PLEWA|nr:hypothetical protein NDU88_008222 [Pleurodeles waltl]